MAMRNGPRTRAIRFALCAWPLAPGACGLRGQGPGDPMAGRTVETAIVPAAVAVAPPAETSGLPGECAFRPAFSLSTGTGAVLGVWRDPSTQDAYVATQRSPNEALIKRVSLHDGTATTVRSVTAAPDSTIVSVWRAHSGDLMLSLRIGEELHLAREHGVSVTEQGFTRYYSPARDLALGPLDDPSDSLAAGLLSEGPGFTAYATMCALETSTAGAPLFCSQYWPSNASLRRVLFGAANASAPIARGHSYGGAASTVVVTRGGAYAWESLGPAPATTGYGSRRTYGSSRRVALTDTARGGPMAATGGAGAVVAWCDPQGALQVQAVTTAGTASGDPLTLPFVDARLEDIATEGGEVFVTLTTRADRDATPRTTTLLRLNPSMGSHSSITTAPVRVPLAAARIVPVTARTVLFWSPDDARALAADCTLLTR